MTELDVFAIASPGSRALKNAKYERYCRLRASAQPRIPAYREAGWETSDDANAYSNGCRLERRSEIRDRIAYLSRQEEELIAAKRRRIEEQLWAIAEGNIQDFFETHEVIQRDHTGQPTHDENGALSTETRVRPKLLTDLPPEMTKLIEDIGFDHKGRAVPKLYSKLQANKELRAMLNISNRETPKDVTQLSDQELIATLADQAKQLGITIDLNYRFVSSGRPQRPMAKITKLSMLRARAGRRRKRQRI
jgi:hypothetical protein